MAKQPGKRPLVDDFKEGEPWRILRIMGEFIEAIDQMSEVGPAVSIFGGARFGPERPYYGQTVELARRLVKRGYTVITGGGPGIMEAGNRGAREAGGHSVGLNIELPHEQKPNEWQTRTLNFRYFFIRKVMFIRYSLGFVVMPGGFGTIDECFEALTLIQTQKAYPFPVILFGSRYWGGLMDWMKKVLVAEGAISPEDLKFLHVVDRPDDAMRVLDKHVEWKVKQILASGAPLKNHALLQLARLRPARKGGASGAARSR